MKTHPVHGHVEFSREGKYRIVGGSDEWQDGKAHKNGYVYLYIPANNGRRGATIWMHRAMWECFNGLIEGGYEIDHIDRNPTNNAITNLRCLTVAENRKCRNHDFIKNMSRNRVIRSIKATDSSNGESFVFKTKTQAGKYYGCSAALVYQNCIGKCKKFGNITFEYTEEPVNKVVPRKEHKRKYNTEEERKAARKEYMRRYKEKKKSEDIV